MTYQKCNNKNCKAVESLVSMWVYNPYCCLVGIMQWYNIDLFRCRDLNGINTTRHTMTLTTLHRKLCKDTNSIYFSLIWLIRGKLQLTVWNHVTTTEILLFWDSMVAPHMRFTPTLYHLCPQVLIWMLACQSVTVIQYYHISKVCCLLLSMRKLPLHHRFSILCPMLLPNSNWAERRHVCMANSTKILYLEQWSENKWNKWLLCL